MPASRLLLSDDASLKRLEARYVYNRATDDLYEVSEEAFAFLERCSGAASADDAEKDFLETCFREGLLRQGVVTVPRSRTVAVADSPSLRYLLVHLTDRCNLRCAHCYLGTSGTTDLPFELIPDMLAEFSDGGGLRLLLSGGEPLLHPSFWQINDLLPGFDVRVVLLTNGTLLDQEVCEQLNVHEVQVSLDGLKRSHDILRGPGSFQRAFEGLSAARDAGFAVSVASTVNAVNVDDFEQLADIVGGLNVWQWTIDVPAVAGRFENHPELWPPLDKAARVLDYAMASGTHGDNDLWLCGAHMATVRSDGFVAKCGLLREVRDGHLRGGLREAWRALPHPTTASLGVTCRSCAYLADCRGGCRFRAGGLHSKRPDPVQCHRYGVL